MKRGLWIAVLLAGLLMSFLVCGEQGIFVREVWTRERPMVGAIDIRSVRDGLMTLADGRVVRPAGVQRGVNISRQDYDLAIQVATAQGVVVTRDLQNGSALVEVEPKFFNSCGTTFSWWTHWAGEYIQLPLSELLIHTGYATQIEDSALTLKEVWRLNGVEKVTGISQPPTKISTRLSAFRFDGSARHLDEDYEFLLGAWQ